MKILSLTLLSLCLQLTSAFAKDPAFKVTLGEHIAGSELTAEDIEGKVIVVHQWNAHCGACPPSLQAFGKMARRKKKSGAAFLIWHSFDTTAMAKEKGEDLKLKTPTYHGNMIKWDEERFGKFVWPHVVILDADGTILYMGAEDRKFKKALKTALKGE